MIYTLYVVDDEKALAKGMASNLGKDYKVETFFTAKTALKAIKGNPPDLVLLDIGLPDMDGIDVLQEIKKDSFDIVVIMITAFEDIETVVAAMRFGAYDYIVKPIQMDALEVTVKNALETIRLRKEVKILQEKYLKENLPCFIGESKAISDVMQFVELAARSPDTPIVLFGQSGTGKELIASAVHYRSPNFKGPLVTVNCAAIPKDLIESELFGYEKGAFSGARESGKKGLVEQAANGTLFLDEIGDLCLEAQAKLLRFLESGEFYRVGGTKKILIKTRVVSATNKNLKEMIKKGLFREDLYFRVGVVKVEVPSLNERREDIIPIARHFLVEFSKKFGKAFTGISFEAETALREFDWKGNVRELRNLIERAVLIAKGPELTLEDLSIQDPKPSVKFNLPQQGIPPVIPEEGIDLPSILESVEKEYIKEALRITGGNETRAAELLNLNYTTFRYRKKIYG
jgi:DNA-binding NtrC family response regulator